MSPILGMQRKESQMQVTLEEVDQLIHEAAEEAKKSEGSAPLASAPHSQGWLKTVMARLAEFFKHHPEPRLEDMGDLLRDVLFILDVDLCCRPWSTGSEVFLFTSPTYKTSSNISQPHSFLAALLAGLDSMHGLQASQRSCDEKFRCRVQKRLARVLAVSGVLKEVVSPLNFSEFFSTRGIYYRGEEVKLAKPISWEGVRLSLPDQVGTLDIRGFCDLGVLRYVDCFTEFLVPEDMRVIGKPPRVLVPDSEWDAVATGLVQRGICDVILEDEVYQKDGKLLLNGLFAVSKDEFQGDTELLRLIMNLKPCNSLCRTLDGDTATLPMATSLGSIYLDEDEVLVVSSEDIRCFFYLFRVPVAWQRYMAFGREVPASLLPPSAGGRKGFLSSRVLPMGFLNSVGIAQRIHRNVVRRAMGSPYPLMGGECELRRDRPPSSAPQLFRVYLDNFDMLTKVNRRFADMVAGKVDPAVQQLRQAYLEAGLPIHPKKSTLQQTQAEVQGAWVNGSSGTITAKPSKMVKYISLIFQALRRGSVSQRELQVIGGGMVYMCMFKRQLLGSLNHIWRMITAMEPLGPRVRVLLRREVALELVRFVCLVPLAAMNLRAGFDPYVTASDASLQGGGVCVSRSLSCYGRAAAGSLVRGDVMEPLDMEQILSIGLFDGIGSLRVSLDMLGAPVVGHISVERSAEARRVLESFYPDTTFVDDIESVDEEMVKAWSLRFSTVSLVVVGAGPPCQGVSALNVDRRGALRDSRSNLFRHVPRVVSIVKRFFPWAQVHSLSENVASMDEADCSAMNEGYELEPWLIDASGISLARRPRLYWISWELLEDEQVTFVEEVNSRLPLRGQVILEAQVNEQDFLEPGWSRSPGQSLPTFTTSRPSERPGRKPAGLATCSPSERARWRQDKHRFPPYQYKEVNSLHHTTGAIRTPSVLERELILGFPAGFTKQCLPKAQHGTEYHSDTRLTLLGNTWSVQVVSWLLSSLLIFLGFIPKISLHDLMARFTPGSHPHLQGLLQRPPVKHDTKSFPLEKQLVQKLSGLISQRGEDLLVQGVSEPPVRYQRLRGSIPGKLWRWRTVTGWTWRSPDEHINSLELRAVYTTMRWRIQQLSQQDIRCVHLIDSLVVLHALSRGRSSSRRLRRVLMKLNALLLATGLQPTWAYIDTKQNPADKPSRWGNKRRWVRKVGKS
eukprot:Skav226488  [mRNA]  locus=scaffold744:92997:96548:- [translate_table: standard]